MKAMILSAGYGTRFRPLTYTMPKPLVPVCNRPLIGWAIESLLRFGVDEIVVNLHHLPELLRSWLDRAYGQRCTIHYSMETEILGTGGGLRRCRSHFESEEVFLVVNGDTVQFPPYDRLLEALRLAGGPAAMLLRRPPRDDRFTGVWLDGDRVSSIGVHGLGESLMFAGVHAMTPEVFSHLPDRDVSGLTEDLYTPLLESGTGIGAAVDDDLWFDVGTPARYLAANTGMLGALSADRVAAPRGNHLQPLQEVLVGPGSVIEGQVMRSVIGEGSIVGRGAQVVDSAIWADVRVGEDVVVENSILADRVLLPSGSVIRNALACSWDERIPHGEGIQRVGDLCLVPVDAREPAILRLDR